MLGAIVGDIIGSTYEGRDLKGFSLPFFTAQSRPTDETYLLLATADVIRHQNKSFAEAYREAYRKDPEAGYGAMFSPNGSHHRTRSSASSTTGSPSSTLRSSS